MENWRKLIRAQKGFTLVELIIVMTLIFAITAAAVPGFMGSLRRGNFEKKVADIVSLFDQARTQALASRIDAAKNIPVGGYGVFIDLTDDPNTNPQKAILFIDDWNKAKNTQVNLDYADLTVGARVLPDGIYTPSQDTELEVIQINSPAYIQMTALSGTKLDGNNWVSASGNQVTVIFKPPYAETVVTGYDGTSVALQYFEAAFGLITDNLTRTIKFNRITTAPQVFQN